MSKNEVKENETNWLDETDIKYSISYLGIENAKSVEWFFRILMNSEEKEIRTKHFAKPDDEQNEASHKYNAEMISRVASRPPIGLPGIDEAMKRNDNDLQKALFEILSPQTPARVRLVEDTWNYYTTVNQPLEFFR